jgi:hypothetical protein
MEGGDIDRYLRVAEGYGRRPKPVRNEMPERGERA